MDRPTCGKCGEVMTPENSRLHPEWFLCDGCLPNPAVLKAVQHLSDRFTAITLAERERCVRIVKQFEGLPRDVEIKDIVSAILWESGEKDGYKFVSSETIGEPHPVGTE